MVAAVILGAGLVGLVAYSRWRVRRIFEEVIESSLHEASTDFELEQVAELRRRLRGIVDQQPIDHGNEPD